MEIENKTSSTLQVVENITKSVLSIGAIIYAWGFLVISIYLSQYHISSLNLLRVQYILAGIWIVIPILLFSILAIWFTAAFYKEFFTKAEEQKDKKKRWFLDFIWKIIIVVMLISGYYFIVSDFLKWIAPTFTSGIFVLNGFDLLKVAGFCLGIAIFLGITWNFINGSRKYPEKKAPYLLWGVLFAIFTTTIALGYTVYFSLYLYPKIPSILGGGQPQNVKIMIGHGDDYESLRKALNFDNNQELSSTLKLITTTDEIYLILDPINTYRAIVLPKNSVSLLILEFK
jgi:hypothetical protein